VKLIRHGDVGSERPGLIDPEGRRRDLSGILTDVSRENLTPASLRRLASVATAELPLIADSVRLGPCVAHAGKFICVGLNYLDHVKEAGASVPSEPILFMKATSAISGPDDDLVIPAGASMVDWEVELGVVIGSTAKNVGLDDAMNHIAGYCVVNDVSERGWQLQGTGQWVKGKSADSFGPIGPWLVTRDEVSDPQALRLELSVNGQIRQNSSTAQMIFSVRTLVSYISKYMTLLPGDIIATGTPPGVAMGAKPPVYLKVGDAVTLQIEGLGRQTQKVTAG
jgi:2-keto-4-pentenoate hydratase/2-oxohepta-3-ene-1,7-dioic acid hydratase in catechol pathway